MNNFQAAIIAHHARSTPYYEGLVVYHNLHYNDKAFPIRTNHDLRRYLDKQSYLSR